jgi:hypothetical protein
MTMVIHDGETVECLLFLGLRRHNETIIHHNLRCNLYIGRLCSWLVFVKQYEMDSSSSPSRANTDYIYLTNGPPGEEDTPRTTKSSPRADPSAYHNAIWRNSSIKAAKTMLYVSRARPLSMYRLPRSRCNPCHRPSQTKCCQCRSSSS